jgi:ABC-2 type transport system permease protein
MLRDTWLLVSLRWRILWNSFRHRSVVTQVFTVLGSVVLGVFVTFALFGVGWGLGTLLHDYPDRDLAALLPGGLLTAITLLILLTSFGVALGSLFLANDLELLMSAPVDRRAVFLSKMLDGMLPSYTILLVTALPALIAFGVGQGWGPLYYLLVVLTLLVLPFFPAGLGALLVMLVARVAPARRVREILGFAGALFGLSCGLLGQTSRFWVPDLVGGPGGAKPDVQALLDSVRGLASLPIPPLMAGRGLVSAGFGDWDLLLVSYGGYLLSTVGFFALCVWLADHLYAAGWVRMQSSGSSKRGRARSVRAAARSGWLGRAPAWFAITLKDWRVLPRDLRNFAQMLAPLALLPFAFFSLVAGFNTTSGGGGRGGRGNPFDSFGGVSHGALGVFVSVGVLVALLFVFGRLAETSISMEGKSWWLTKAAPLSPAELLFGKFMSAAIPFTIVGIIFMVSAAIWRGFTFVWFLYGLYGVLMLGLGLLAVAVGLSVPWAKLDWDDPRRMLSPQTAIFTMIGWFVLGLMGGGILCLPFLLEAFNPGLVGVMMLLAAVLSTLVTGAVAYGVFRFGMNRLWSVGEN